ncbi:MAG: class I SAM-dependent methyltransferase, partial [Salinisphaera sp.]|nr:class I SAM-dependent methyltransferase [Salinisphaera sp.]
MDKPHAPACLRNRDPILAVLCQHLADCRSLLEIGSGTGQHAVYFGAALPQLRWQTSDLPENHHGIDSWIAAAGLPNVLPPLALDVDASWPKQSFDAVFSANTLHIMDWQAVRSFFAGVPSVV